MQEDESKDEKVCELVLLMKTSLTEKYKFVFPNGEDVILSICKISGVSVEAGEYILQGKNVIVELVKDIQSFLQYFAVKKRMSIIKIGVHCVDNILSEYDLIICESLQKYCIYFEQPSLSLASYIFSSKMEQKVLRVRLQRGYNAILSDLRQHHLILGNQWNASNLRIINKPDRLLLQLPRSYKIIGKSFDHYQFSINQSISHPYLEDINKMNQVLEQIMSKTKKNQEPIRSNVKKDNNIEHILLYSDFMHKLERQNFTGLSSNPLYEPLMKDRCFLIKLYQHFKQTSSVHCLQSLIVFLKKPNMPQLNQQSTICNHAIAQSKLELDLMLKNIGKTSNISLYDMAKKIYYNPLKMKNIEKIEGIIISPEDINWKAQKIQTSLKKGKSMFHFLRGKQAFNNNLLFRALGHYRKALLYSKEQQKCIIFGQIGSILIQLNCYEEAQQKLRQSLRIRINIWGKNHIKMLVPLHNLMNLHLRKHQLQQAHKLYEHCQQIKAQYNFSNNFRLFPQTIPIFYSQTIFANHYLFDKTKSKNTKAIGKKQISKFMVEKYPFLQHIYSATKNMLFFNDIQQKQAKKFQKKKLKTQLIKDQTKVLYYFDDLRKRMQFGQLNNMFYFLRIIFCLCNQTKLTQLQLQAISHLINQAKENNRKDYIRFTFLMSYYYQRHNQSDKAIQLIELLINSSQPPQFQVPPQQQLLQDTKPYIQQQIIQQRYLQLCKKTQSTSKLLQIYSTIGWFQQNKASQLLYDAILFLKDRKQCLLTIRACKTYLSYHQQNINTKNKEIVMILVKQLLDYELVHEAWKEINKVFMYFFDENYKKEVYNIIGKISVFANKHREYQLCIKIIQFLSKSKEMVNLDKELLEPLLNAAINSFIQLNYQYDPKLFMEINENNAVQFISSELLQKIKGISKRKESWKSFLDIVIQQKGSDFTTTKILSLDQLANNQQLFKDSIKHYLQSGLFNQFIDAHNANQTFNAKISKYSQTIIQLSLQYGQEKGYNSQLAIYLQCFLFLALQKENIYERLLLHIWFISLSRRTSQQKQKLIFGGRLQRQKTFDGLLLQYFNIRRDSQMKESPLSKLAWFEKKSKQLQKLYHSYQRINTNETTLGNIQEFSILYSSYSSLDESNSLLLQFAKSKEEALMNEQTEQWQN